MYEKDKPEIFIKEMTCNHLTPIFTYNPWANILEFILFSKHDISFDHILPVGTYSEERNWSKWLLSFCLPRSCDRVLSVTTNLEGSLKLRRFSLHFKAI